MNFRKLIYIAALVLAVVSCSKDEETEATPGLNGTLSIVGLPEFMSPGATFTLHPKGAVHPDGKELNYSWKVSPSMSKYDTTEVFTHTFLTHFRPIPYIVMHMQADIPVFRPISKPLLLLPDTTDPSKV